MDPTAQLIAISRNVSLPQLPTTWDGFFTVLATADVPADFLSQAERHQDLQSSDDSPAQLDGLAL